MFREIRAKHLIGKCGLGSGMRSVNTFAGCTHACVYCYAVFMRRCTKRAEAWGTYADAKINAPEVFAADYASVKPGDHLLFGSVTDVYQPLEKKYGLMRGILEILVREGERKPASSGLFACLPDEEPPADPFRGITFSILTKSDLVLRDLDLIRRIPSMSVGFSIAMPDDRARLIFEPGASPLERRLDALRRCREAGIPNFVFINPMIPMITPLEKIFARIAPYADSVFGESLNLRYGGAREMEDAVRRYDPGLLFPYREMVGNLDYWLEVKKLFHQLVEKYKIPSDGFHVHRECFAEKESRGK